MRGIAVGRIHPDFEPTPARVGGQPGTLHPEQRPHQRTAHDPHSAQPAEPRALEGAHEDRLALIVGVVRREDGAGTQPCAQRMEPGVACLARRRLSRFGTEPEPCHLDLEAEPLAQRDDAGGDPGTLGMNAVIGVGDDQLETGIGGAMEEIQQDHGVEPAGHGHQRAAFRQRQRREGTPELLEEVHHTQK